MWVANETVYAERDSLTPNIEQLTALAETAAYVNVRHGGRRFEVSTRSADRAFELRQGQWVATNDTATTPYGGAFLSLFQLSHDRDSSVTVNPHSGDGFVDLEVVLRDSAFRLSSIHTIHVPLPRSGYEDSTGGVGGSAWIGTFTTADWRVAYAPPGDRVLVAVTLVETQSTGKDGPFTCPWALPGDPPSCYRFHYHTATQYTDVHAIELPSGTDSVLWRASGQQVYWLAESEDGAQVVGGEGQMTQDYVIEPIEPWPPGPVGYRSNAQPQVVSGCSIVYRIAAAGGTQLHSVTSGDACRGDQGQGTLAPIRTATR